MHEYIGEEYNQTIGFTNLPLIPPVTNASEEDNRNTRNKNYE